ncbi:PDC sensor domain-containing protein, partial [Piscinibacter sakaiensis]
MRFPRSRTLVWIGSLLALFPLLSLAIAAWLQFDRLRDDEAARLMGTATVIEDHATRSVDAVGNALSALAEHVAAEGAVHPATLAPLLQQSLASLPVLRSLAAVDAQGQVLASTVAAEVGLVIDPGLLGVQPEAG